MVKQHGAALDLMRQIKGLLDPNGILNPAKCFRSVYLDAKATSTSRCWRVRR